MKSRMNCVFFLLATALLVGCGKTQLRKTKGGMPYQVFKGKGDRKLKVGEFIKVHITRTINDSVYFTTTETLPTYIQVSDKQEPYDISELWTSLRVGDSVVASQVMDTFIKRNPANANPKFGPGTRIKQYIKILDVFSSDTLAREDYLKGNDAWLSKEIKTIEKHLAENNIIAEKTPSGAFVQILVPGTGNLIDSGKNVSVNYTGTSWSGKKFDSNTDPLFQHVAPMPFVVGVSPMIKGFDEAVRLMRKGAKAKVFIPSVLAYAGSPDSPLIKPYEILVFDLEILDVGANVVPPARR